MSLQVRHAVDPQLLERSSSMAQAPANRRPHFLHAGKIYVSSEHESILLILGSCVAVCIWDPLAAIGGATHYLLPAWDGQGLSSARYGNIAISELLQSLACAGAVHQRLRAKVFGGGSLLGFENKLGGSNRPLGSRNVDLAIEMLSSQKIPLLSLEAGGNRGQRIIFHTHTGETAVTRL